MFSESRVLISLLHVLLLQRERRICTSFSASCSCFIISLFSAITISKHAARQRLRWRLLVITALRLLLWLHLITYIVLMWSMGHRLLVIAIVTGVARLMDGARGLGFQRLNLHGLQFLMTPLLIASLPSLWRSIRSPVAIAIKQLLIASRLSRPAVSVFRSLQHRNISCFVASELLIVIKINSL